jgi:glycosyltransferase involved in cell wall biosynthesis
MSEVEKDALCMLGADNSKIRVIHHGVEFQQITERQKRTLRNSLGIMEKAKIIVCVSRIDMNIVRFFVHLLKKLDTNYVAILAGGIVFYSLESIRKVIPNYLRDRIIITKYLPREELNTVYEIGHYFVKPTNYEAFGIAFIEAMSAGLPILSYRVGALPEIIKNGQNGFLFEENDENKMVEKIKELQSDKKLYYRISLQNREQAKQYSWDKILCKYIEIYEELERDIQDTR